MRNPRKAFKVTSISHFQREWTKKREAPRKSAFLQILDVCRLLEALMGRGAFVRRNQQGGSAAGVEESAFRCHCNLTTALLNSHEGSGESDSSHGSRRRFTLLCTFLHRGHRVVVPAKLMRQAA